MDHVVLIRAHSHIITKWNKILTLFIFIIVATLCTDNGYKVNYASCSKIGACLKHWYTINIAYESQTNKKLKYRLQVMK